MGSLSLSHWIIILIIVLVVFGPGRLPGLGKSLGESIKGFKNAMNSDNKEKEEERARQAAAERLERGTNTSRESVTDKDKSSNHHG